MMTKRLPNFNVVGGMIALALCACALPGCGRAPVEPLRIGTQPWPGYELMYLANSLGYYDDLPIRLIDYPSGSEELRAYRNGSVGASALTMDETLLLQVQGGDPQVVLVFDVSHGGDVVMAKEGIECMADLKGKRIGVESGALGGYVLSRALEISGLDPADLNFVTLEVSEHERAFKAGDVDAVVTFEPVRTALLEFGANQIFDSSQMPNEIFDVLVVRKEIAGVHRETIRGVIDGWARAVEYLRENPEDAAERIASRLEMSPEAFLASLDGLKIPTLNENRALFLDADSILLEAVERLNKTMAKNGLLPNEADLDGLVNGGFLPETIEQ